MSPADELARRIGAKRVGREFRTNCPCHEDSHPSCDFRDGEKGIVFSCRSAGCASSDIASHFRAQHPDLFTARVVSERR